MTGGDQGRYVIDGRFELLERLGGGGMGLVWRARDLMLRREVALKEVRSPDPSVHGSDPAGQRVVRERVLREARALARLQHPNVVTIYHIVDSSELAHPWLVMELVTGGTLGGLLDERDLTVPEALRVGRGVLGALRAAHAAGIQHRDVKPGNVLLREDGTPVLTDFGIAALEASPGLTATGMLIGSPEYMAPERVHGVEGDPASDLWSLALMLYVGLEGRNPLSRETTIATIAAVSEGYVPPPVRSGVMAPILSAVLVPDPSRRPSAEMLDAMFAQAEAGGIVTNMAAAGYGEWSQPRYGGGNGVNPGVTTDQLPGMAPRPVANPYGDTGQSSVHVMSPEAAERYRSKAFRLSTISTVCVLGLMGFSVWASTRAQNHANQPANNPALNYAPTFSMPSIPDGTTGSSSQSSAGGGSTSADGGPSSSTPAKDLLTPAGIRGVTAQILAASGGTRVTSMTVYNDHASFDVVKKNDPGVYDSYAFVNGRAEFSTTGSALDSSQTTYDPTKIDWSVLPALLKDADSTLNVKNPTYHYVILDSEFSDDGSLEFRVYVGDDYRDGYLAADLKGKVVRRYPQK